MGGSHCHCCCTRDSIVHSCKCGADWAGLRVTPSPRPSPAGEPPYRGTGHARTSSPMRNFGQRRKNYSLSLGKGPGWRGSLLILSFLPLRPIRKCAKSVKMALIAEIPPHPNPLPPGEGTFSPRQGLCKGLHRERGPYRFGEGYAWVSAGRACNLLPNNGMHVFPQGTVDGELPVAAVNESPQPGMPRLIVTSTIIEMNSCDRRDGM